MEKDQLARRSWILWVCLCCTSLPLARMAQAQSAIDLDGNPVNPLAQASGRIVILIFLREDCPVSNRYAPVIQQISSRYQQDAIFFLVYPDKDESAQRIRKHLADYGYTLPAVRDPQHVLVKLAHAEITPEAAVFNRDHQLIYYGRIDNWYVEFGKPRPAPTTHELIDAIEAGIARKLPAQSSIKGVGCYIADLQ
jgi:thiol-disulfide isomerase/thioredoxin